MYPLIRISSGFEIPVFYLVLSLVICVCLIWLSKRISTQQFNRKTAFDVAFVIMASALIGARLFHVFYENPEIYQDNPWAVLFILNGGFVFYGGFLLAAICGYLFLKWKRVKNILTYFDLFAPICSLAYALGRWGCFFAGCCYGKSCDLPWAIANRHPTQIYASLWEFGVLSLLLAFEKKSHRKSGQIFFLWIILHSVGRLLMESFRADFRGPTAGLSISSWLSLTLLFVGILGMHYSQRTKK